MSIIFLIASQNVNSKSETHSGNVNDLFYGEALFYAYQDDYFSAITRLDAELKQHYELDQPELDSLSEHRGVAEFSVGDLELSYRMHQQAGRALERVFSESIDQSIKNQAAYRMARIFFQKRYFTNTIHALNLIRGDVPKELAEDVSMLRAQAEMTQQNFSRAIELLRPIRQSEYHEGYAMYNLGIAYIRNGDAKKGADILDKVGLFSSRNSIEIVALRDKANLALGYKLLEEGYASLARPYFERIRLNGPFSNKALLWAGWADIAQQQYDKALVPWTRLHERDPTDSAVQESLLALPYAYSKLEAYGRAALLYGEAITEFNKEIDRLDGSIQSIMQGRLLTSLVQQESEQNPSFLARLKKLPDAPETRYLLELMASHNFQESVKNYRDLAFLQRNLKNWQGNIDSYDDLLKRRRAYYQPLLPSLEEKFSKLDKRMGEAIMKRDRLNNQLDLVQRIRDPKALATNKELKLENLLLNLEMRINKLHEKQRNSATIARIHRLKGILHWRIFTDYENRLDHARKRIKGLDKVIDDLQHQHLRTVRFKREAYQSFEGYQIPLRKLKTRLNSLSTRTAAIMAQQGRFLEKQAVKELDRRRQKLVDYQSKARFAIAESYDKATKKQQKSEEILQQDNADESSNKDIL